jgi:hypothetical protein
MTEGHLAGTQYPAAPAQRAAKMRTSSHFDGRGATAVVTGPRGLRVGASGAGAQGHKGEGEKREGLTVAAVEAHVSRAAGAGISNYGN